MTDGPGKRSFLSDGVIVMSSNLCTENFRKLSTSLAYLNRVVGIEQVQGEVMRELERRFPPEFRNRIDEVVLFNPLTHDEVRHIAKTYLKQVTLALAKAGKTIAVTDEAIELVVMKGYSMAFGSRFLKRFIDEHVKLPISAHWKDGSHSDVTMKDGAIAVEPSVKNITSPDAALEY